MTAEVEAHETAISLAQVPEAEVRGRSDMALMVQVACSSGCDLWGGTVQVVAQDGAVAAESVLVTFDGTASLTREFAVRAPFEPGEYTWTARFPAQKKKGILHAESSAQFPFVVAQHVAGVTVWDVPSTVLLGGPLKIKAGVRCSSECSLAGQKIVVRDIKDAELATATLGDLPWPGTAALYWAEVELQAPETEGRYRWRAVFPRPDLEPEHDEAAGSFAFSTAKQADHVVTVEVVARDGQSPVRDARVRLQPRLYRGTTYVTRSDERGMAILTVPTGIYHFYAWDEQHEKNMPGVKVEGDLTIRAELSAARGSWREISIPGLGRLPPEKPPSGE